MSMIKKLAGKILYYLGKLIEVLLDTLIMMVSFIVRLVAGVGRGLLGLISMGGCMILFLLGPFGIALLFNPLTISLILFFVLVPILGSKFISYLKYLRYMVTEYLFDRSDDLIKGKSSSYRSFNEYGDKYKRMEEEKRRKEQQRRQEEQQRQWEERFKQWNQYQESQNRRYESYNQNTGYGNRQTYVNPAIDFKKKYEKSCDLLGLNYDTDKYQVKLAYRKKAKEYHPDINKSPNATEVFQQINDAYEFLSDANIERYENLR